MKSESDLPIYNKQVVFIFDEAHRSQFGEAQKNLKKKFKKFYQFGFTGTPIFPENSLGSETTAGVFGCELHSYVITDAIRDEKLVFDSTKLCPGAFIDQKLTARQTQPAL